MSIDDRSLIAQVEALRLELEHERHLARHDPLTGALTTSPVDVARLANVFDHRRRGVRW